MATLANSSRVAMGEWLGGMDWDYWATLTTRRELTLKSARRAAMGFEKFLSKAGNTQIFFAVEPFDIKEGYHLHALMKLPTNLSYRNIVEVWQHVSGNKKKRKGKEWNAIKLEKYNPKLGAGHYLSKYITKELSDYDMIGSKIKYKY